MQFHASPKISFFSKLNFNPRTLLKPKRAFSMLSHVAIILIISGVHEPVSLIYSAPWSPGSDLMLQYAQNRRLILFRNIFIIFLQIVMRHRILLFNVIRLFIVKMNIIQNQVYKNFKFLRIELVLNYLKLLFQSRFGNF